MAWRNTGFGLFMGFVHNNKKHTLEYLQPYHYIIRKKSQRTYTTGTNALKLKNSKAADLWERWRGDKHSERDQRMNWVHYNEGKHQSLGLRGECVKSKSSEPSGLPELIPFPAASQLNLGFLLNFEPAVHLSTIFTDLSSYSLIQSPRAVRHRRWQH